MSGLINKTTCHEDCEFLKGHGDQWLSKKCECGGSWHAISSDWSDYNFGHAGGDVYFKVKCFQCGKIDQDHDFRG